MGPGTAAVKGARRVWHTAGTLGGGRPPGDEPGRRAVFPRSRRDREPVCEPHDSTGEPGAGIGTPGSESEGRKRAHGATD